MHRLDVGCKNFERDGKAHSRQADRVEPVSKIARLPDRLLQQHGDVGSCSGRRIGARSELAGKRGAQRRNACEILAQAVVQFARYAFLFSVAGLDQFALQPSFVRDVARGGADHPASRQEDGVPLQQPLRPVLAAEATVEPGRGDVVRDLAQFRSRGAAIGGMHEIEKRPAAQVGGLPAQAWFPAGADAVEAAVAVYHTGQVVTEFEEQRQLFPITPRFRRRAQTFRTHSSSVRSLIG